MAQDPGNYRVSLVVPNGHFNLPWLQYTHLKKVLALHTTSMQFAVPKTRLKTYSDRFELQQQKNGISYPLIERNLRLLALSVRYQDSFF